MAKLGNVSIQSKGQAAQIDAARNMLLYVRDMHKDVVNKNININ